MINKQQKESRAEHYDHETGSCGEQNNCKSKETSTPAAVAAALKGSEIAAVETMAQKALVHKQFNSPLGLYSDNNIKETLNRELKTLSNGIVG